MVRLISGIFATRWLVDVCLHGVTARHEHDVVDRTPHFRVLQRSVGRRVAGQEIGALARIGKGQIPYVLVTFHPDHVEHVAGRFTAVEIELERPVLGESGCRRQLHRNAAGDAGTPHPAPPFHFRHLERALFELPVGRKLAQLVLREVVVEEHLVARHVVELGRHGRDFGLVARRRFFGSRLARRRCVRGLGVFGGVRGLIDRVVGRLVGLFVGLVLRLLLEAVAKAG